MNIHNVKPGDIIQYSNAHKGAKSLLEFTETIVKCCQKKVFYFIRGDHSRVFCSYWNEFNAKWDDMRAYVIGPDEKPRHVPGPDYHPALLNAARKFVSETQANDYSN